MEDVRTDPVLPVAPATQQSLPPAPPTEFQIKNIDELAPDSKLTDNETIKYYYLHYLAIIDNIHDFFHKRGENCPYDFKTTIVKKNIA